MITIEEAEKRFAKGEFVAGMKPVSEFCFTSKVDGYSKNNI